jgi:hypothetical protein
MSLLKAAVAAALMNLSAAGCVSEDSAGKYGPGELDHASLRPTPVKGRILASGDYLGAPTAITRVGDQLLILDAISDSVLHVVDAQSGRHVRSLGRRGEGPGEYRGAWSLPTETRPPRRPWVYDLQLARLTRVALEARPPSAPEPEMIRLTGDAIATQPVWVGDSLLVSPSFSPGGRLSFFGSDGRFRRAAGALPAGNGGIPPAILQQAWVGSLISNPRTGELALLTRHADQIEIYEPDGNLLNKVRGPFRFDPQFTVSVMQGQQVMATGDAMRFGYIDAVGTPDEIYALFSGRTRESFKQASSFARYLHVYDWRGEFKRAYQFDSDILAIGLSPDRTLLYGIRHEPEPAIMAFPIER